MSDTKSNWNPDEIPGLTTFLYSQNRFREPHEFVNACKWEEKAEEKRKHLGVPLHEGTDELLDRIQSLQYRLEEADMTPELNRLTNELDQLRTELAQSRTLASEFRKKHEDAARGLKVVSEELDARNQHLTEQREQLIKYGDHHPDCNVVDAMESGRMLEKTEKDACTCGWTSNKLAVLAITGIT